MTQKTTRVNLSNSWPKLWDCDNLIEKNKKNIKSNSQPTQCWMMKLKEKKSIERKEKKTTGVNLN
jgi:hypothetical protein